MQIAALLASTFTKSIPAELWPGRCEMGEVRAAAACAGGTDRAVGAAPESPEGSPWHQGPSPSYSLPGEAYPAGHAGRLSGSETPDFEDKAARAPWHQPAPAADRLGFLHSCIPERTS